MSEQKTERAAQRRREEALRREGDAQRRAAKTAEWRATGAYLSYEEFVAGVPCRGCGMPWIDNLAPANRGTMNYTDEERARVEAERVAFQARHPDCHDALLSVGGSLTLHCFACCPTLPLAPSQRDRLAALFRERTPDTSLNRWSLELTCGHTVERTAHYSNDHPFSLGTTVCETCDEIRGIVGSTNLGRAAEPPPPPSPKEEDRKRALAKVAAQREALLEAERVLALLEGQLSEHPGD